MNALSNRVGDRNLFSGDETNQPTYAAADTLLSDVKNIMALAPTVADAEIALDDYFNTPGGGFETNIYLGGDGNPPALPLGNGETVRLDLTGNNQEFKDTLRGLAVIATAVEARPSDDAGTQQLFESGTQSLTKGKTGLLKIETELGVHSSTIEKVNQRNASEALGLATAFQNLFGRDQFEALAQANVKIKDIVDVEGVRANDLVGYGLVIGLDGTGDTIRNSPYTEEALSNLLERLGVNIQGSDFRPNNVAAVLVTGSLRPFARVGSSIDINVSSIGDAKSLSGGTLVMTPLNGADGEVYALAQGSVLVSGFQAEGAGASITEGVPTSGSIPNGARIEREINFDFSQMKKIRLALRSPDFTTAERVEDKINKGLGGQYATLLDSGTVELDLAGLNQSPARIIGQVENFTLKPAQKARVVVDQRSGTLPDLVAGLNALGVTPREMIDILKSIKTAGALHAELVLQ